MARCDCGCGALWFGDLDPELYRTAVALVSAYTFGDLAAFDELFDEAPRSSSRCWSPRCTPRSVSSLKSGTGR